MATHPELLPTIGSLTTYVIGPGIGESQIVVLPDNRVIVVDSCMEKDANLVERLLDDLGLGSIDLLVITHPDLDHIRGLADLIRRFSPNTVWRHPIDLERELVMAALELDPGNARLEELREAADALEDLLAATGRVCTVNASTRSWSPTGAAYRVHCLAPTHFDQERGRGIATDLLRRTKGKNAWTVTEAFRRRLEGTSPLRVRGNALSLGVLIEWGSQRVLLSGDIENGLASPHSGWKGVLRLLDDDGNLGLVTDVAVVKVAHHGSSGAFHDAAWQLHAKSAPTIGLVAPFSPSSLPDGATLSTLRSFCRELGATIDPGNLSARAIAAGWKTITTAPIPHRDGRVLKAVVDASGAVSLRRTSMSHVFH